MKPIVLSALAGVLGRGAAKSRRATHPRRGRRSARAMAAERRADGGSTLRRRARAAPGLHRCAAPRRPRRDALGGGSPRSRRRTSAAAGPRRSRDRPLGPGRLLRPGRCAPSQHGDGVPPQRRALSVPQVGDAGIRRPADRPTGVRHLSPGEPRVPGARRPREGRRAVSRHAGRHRFAHDDGQRARRRRLGSRLRDRAGGGDARPAGLPPPARRGRRAPPRSTARGRDRDRPGPAHHRAPATSARRRQVRRVPRRGRRQPVRAGPRHAREHGARVRRDGRLLPGRRAVLPLPPGDRPERRARGDGAPLLPGPGAVRDARARSVRLHDRRSTWTSPPSSRRSPVRSGRRTGSPLGRLKEQFLALLTRPDGYGKPAAEVARSVQVRLGDGSGAAPRWRRPVRRDAPGWAREEHQPTHRGRDDEQPADAEPARPGELTARRERRPAS